MKLQLTFTGRDTANRWTFLDQNGKAWYSYDSDPRALYCCENGKPMPDEYEPEFDIIGTLNMHCGDCGVADFCPSGECADYAICSDERFRFVKEDTYKEIAEKACWGDLPERPSCSEHCDSEDCGSVADAQYRQLADSVYKVLKQRGVVV